MFDIIILGSGPAGMAAAIYAKRAKLETMIIDRNGFGGGQVLSTYEVDNYPGIPGVSGMVLSSMFQEHAEKMGATVIGDEVEDIRKNGDFYEVVCSGQSYETKGIVIATGAQHAHLNVKGEEELAGMGVSYCATCDGAFFEDRTVAVVGGGDVAVEDAIFLSRTCKKVYLIHRRDELRAAKVLQDSLFACPNVEILWDTVVEEIQGQDEVENIQIRNKRTDEVKTLPLDGVFIAVGILPNSELFRSMLQCDANGYIVAGEDGRTSEKGIYAAGDVRTKELRQIVTAVSDGANAINSYQRDFI